MSEKNRGQRGKFKVNKDYYTETRRLQEEFEYVEFPRLTLAPVIDEPTSDHCRDYAVAVSNGDIIAGPHVRAACRRHIRDLETAESRGLWFDHGAYQWFAQFCETYLRFYQGQYYGQPFILQPAQEFIAGSIFGWRMWREGYPEDNPTVWPRRFRRCYLEMGKGNGKTPIMGAVALYGLLADKEPGAEIYIGASKQKQAHVCFDDAVKMARASPIYDRLRITGISPPTRIDHLASESFVDLLSSESKNSESGIKPHIVLLDEIHEHRDGLLVDMMQRGFKWRRQPLLVMSTNSGWDVTSVAWEEHEHGRKVAHGEIESDESFAYVCALDPGDDPLKDEGRTTWAKANPLLGHAQTVDSLEQAVADAGSYPSRIGNILRLHFCVWTEGETAWVSKDMWESIETPEKGDLELLRDRPCILTIDLSQKHDTTGLCYMGPTGYTDDGKSVYTAITRAYLPTEGIREKMDRDKRPYADWARLYPDQLRLTEGPTVEQEAVIADILDDLQVVDCQAILYDSFLFDQFSRLMQVMGVDPDIPLVEHPQGWTKRRTSPLSMSISIGVLERYMQTKRLFVHVNPMLRAAVAGARQLPSPSGQTRWDKAKSTSRIDVLVALTMAAGAWEVGPNNLEPSGQATNKKDRLRELWAGYNSDMADSFVGLRA